MDTWSLLKKELAYYGIDLISSQKCKIGDQPIQGTIRTIRDLYSKIKVQKKILLETWNEMLDLLNSYSDTNDIIDEKMVDLFIFSLKDLSKFLLCFENAEKSEYYRAISECLSRDIKTFSKHQIYTVPNYKICIDWISRTISRLLYIAKLLAFASLGKKRISTYKIKTAKGIEGPWAHLDLPMEERVFPFGDETQTRTKAKQKQRRYRKGLENYNNDGRVGEGHYWRELRNEPFDWFDRNYEDPYPSRNLLSR